MNINARHLLTDEQMTQFITAGYVRIDTPDIAQSHAEVCTQIETAFEEGNPGNAILPKAPALYDVIEHPAFCGAAASLLGDDYWVCAHRHPHMTQPNSDKQALHQDGTQRKLQGWSRPWFRHHRTRKLLVVYFPEAVPAEMGPTGVLPGSQYYNHQPTGQDAIEKMLVSPAGAVYLCHFDIWHRANANQSDRRRLMVKFVLSRKSEPAAPSWNHDANFTPDFNAIAAKAREEEGPLTNQRLPNLWRSLWRWHAGLQPESGDGDASTDASENLQADLSRIASARIDPQSSSADANSDASTEASEDQQVGLPTNHSPAEPFDEGQTIEAAYRLARHPSFATPALVQIIREQEGLPREFAALSLAAMSAPGSDALVDLANDDNPELRIIATDMLAAMGRDAAGKLAAVLPSLKADDVWVRHNVLNAMAVWGRASLPAQREIEQALDDAEPWVRYNAMLALTGLGNADALPAARLKQLAEDHAPNVQWLAKELLGEHSRQTA